MAHASLLPRGRAAWPVGVLLAAFLGLSSAAPFVQFGGGFPMVGVADVRTTGLYVVTWLPLFAVAAWFARRARTGAAAWTTHLSLAIALPVAHTVAFLTVDGALIGRPISVQAVFGSVAFPVLTMLGMLQYLVLAVVVIAGVASRSAAELEALADRARIEALTSQLRPHFLFNALNSIAVLTTSDPAAAQTMVRRLSTLLRATLAAGDRATVPLSDELELLSAYVDIQRARFGDGLKVQVHVEPGAGNWLVPTLILQPLVENAVEHAVARTAGGAIEVSARQSGDRLVLTVNDDGVADQSMALANGAASGHGIGLANTRERLDRLYGPAHRFTVDYAASGGCTVRIELPRSRSDVQAP